jgi:hypothetical protein
MSSFRESIFQVPALLFAVIFFAFILGLNWLGYRMRKKIALRYPDKDVGVGTGEGAILGLMALLIAFTFNLANTKYESRRQAIIDEANLMNTAILRCDLYPDSVKYSLLPLYQQYLESRIAYYEAGDSPTKIKAALADTDEKFKNIWKKNVVLTRDAENRIRSEQMVQILIGLKNIVRTREAVRVSSIPTLILLVLLLLVGLGGFLTGYGIKPGNRSVFLSVAFALMTATALYLVMELSRPRQGSVNLDTAEQNIVDLRKLFP